VKYANYANEYQDARPHCASTRQLEYHLQKMQIFCNDAVFLLSRIQSALKTLEINGKNFARRLEEIRHETPDNPWQLDINEKIQLRAENELSVLKPFYRAIRRLENHQVYLETQVKYLSFRFSSKNGNLEFHRWLFMFNPFWVETNPNGVKCE